MKDFNAEILKTTERLLYYIHMGYHRKIYNLCKDNVFWKYNHNYSKGIMNKRIITNINTIIRPSEVRNIEHIQYTIQDLFKNHVAITGIYCIYKTEKFVTKKHYFDYTVIFSDGQACYIQIFGNKIPIKIHKIISTEDIVYNLQEDDLLYVEAMRNHILWHCNDGVIESAGPLKNIEDNLSDNFVKVHRSYIVNVNFVKNVQRCHATMTNGDIIPIPYKKYVDIKKKLLEL